MTIRDDILRSYAEAQEALTNYLQAMKQFMSVYDSILKGLHRKYPNSKICRKWNGTELLQFNPDCPRSVLLVANFYGDEVFSSLSLLLCLEVCEIFKFKIFAIPVANKTGTRELDLNFRKALLRLAEQKRIDFFIAFSQGHPYLDGFYVEIPSRGNFCDKSITVVREVSDHGHEVGVFADKFGKPTYAILNAGPSELISQMSEKGIEAYRFAVSKDIWAGYRATLALLTNGHRDR